MQFTDYTLPEFVFLDGNSPCGDTLEGRTVIQHIRSYTIMEVIALDEVAASDFKTKTFEFHYENKFCVTERHMLALHFSLAEDDQLNEVLEKTAAWYLNYLGWEDNNIDLDNQSQRN